MNIKNIKKYFQHAESVFLTLFVLFGLSLLVTGMDANPESILADAYARPSLALERSPIIFFLFYLTLIAGLFSVAAKVPRKSSLVPNHLRDGLFVIISLLLLFAIPLATRSNLPFPWIIGLEGIALFVLIFGKSLTQNSNK